MKLPIPFDDINILKLLEAVVKVMLFCYITKNIVISAKFVSKCSALSNQQNKYPHLMFLTKKITKLLSI